MLSRNSRRRLVVALSALILAAPCSVAFPQEKPQAKDVPCSSSTVFVSALDANGKFVSGLTAESFHVRLHGHPVKVLSEGTNSSPRRIVLVLDTSASMLASDPAIWKPTLVIAKTLVEGLPPQDSIAFVSFASRVEQQIDFTRDRTPILQQLDELQGGKRAFSKKMRATALWNSVLESLRLFDSPQIGDSIYVISDGDDDLSRAGPSDVENALLAARVRLFALFPPGVPRPPMSGYLDRAGPLQAAMDLEEPEDMTVSAPSPQRTQGESDLGEIAKMTGGALLASYQPSLDKDTRPLTPAQLGAALDRLRSATDQLYQLEVELPQPPDKHPDLRIEVADQRQKIKDPLVLLYPRKIRPCGASH